MVTKPTAGKTTRRKKPSTDTKRSTIWQDLAAIGCSVPKELRAKLPRDLAMNFDHYHDGSPRQD